MDNIPLDDISCFNERQDTRGDSKEPCTGSSRNLPKSTKQFLIQVDQCGLFKLRDVQVDGKCFYHALTLSKEIIFQDQRTL